MAAQRKASGAKRESAGSGRKGRSGGSTRTGSAAGSRAGSKKTTYRQPAKRDAAFFELQNEIILMAVLVVSVLLFLSNFNLGGKVGNAVNGFMFGVFGLLNYLLPVLLFCGTAFYLANRGNRALPSKLLCLLGMLFMVTALLQLLTAYTPEQLGSQDTAGFVFSFKDYFRLAKQYKKGGGVCGGVICFLFEPLFGKVGTFVVVIALLLVFFMLFSRKAVFAWIARLSKDRYAEHKVHAEERREYYEQRQAERARIIEEKRQEMSERRAKTYLLSEKEKNSMKPSKEREAEEAEQEAQAKKKEKKNFFGGKTPTGDYVYGTEYKLPKKTANEVDRLYKEDQKKLHKQEKKDVVLREKKDAVLQEKEEAGRLSLLEISPKTGEYININTTSVENGRREAFLANGDFFDTDDSRITASGNGSEQMAPVDAVAAEETTRNPWAFSENRSERAAAEKGTETWRVSSTPVDAAGEKGTEAGKASSMSASTAEEKGTETWKVSSMPVDAAEEKGTKAERVSSVSANAAEEKGTEAGKVSSMSSNAVGEKGAEAERVSPVSADAAEKGAEAGKVSSVSADVAAETEPLVIEEPKPVKKYEFPSFDLLTKPKAAKAVSESAVRETAMKLQTTLDSFGVRVNVTNVSCGPSVTRYELLPEQGVKVSRITSLADDIKLNLAAADIRIEAPIPGKAAVGIEVPNKENSTVFLRELLESKEFESHASRLAFAVGKDIGGQTVVTDIAKMPHLLIAGATGSGKSVCINTLIMSILYKADPKDVKLIMVDPKVVELSVYNGIPHLMIPVVTDPKKASAALNWAVMEMTDRYNKFAELGVRDLKGYNERVDDAAGQGLEEEKYKRLPQIVIIVDELADLMMVAPGEVEDSICRLAQLARAAGLHLVIATQRPSVNVITGLIKANIPSRIAFAVSSAIDSRTILDGAGAEKLLGKGDMLFFPSGYSKPVRVQGAFVSDHEVSAVVDFLKAQCEGVTGTDEKILSQVNAAMSAAGESSSEAGSSDGRDEYFAEAGRLVIEKDKASIGMLQRAYKVGFNRAARIMDQLSEAGVVGPEQGTKSRQILMTAEEFEQFIGDYV